MHAVDLSPVNRLMLRPLLLIVLVVGSTAQIISVPSPPPPSPPPASPTVTRQRRLAATAIASSCDLAIRAIAAAAIAAFRLAYSLTASDLARSLIASDLAASLAIRLTRCGLSIRTVAAASIASRCLVAASDPAKPPATAAPQPQCRLLGRLREHPGRVPWLLRHPWRMLPSGLCEFTRRVHIRQHFSRMQWAALLRLDGGNSASSTATAAVSSSAAITTAALAATSLAAGSHAAATLTTASAAAQAATLAAARSVAAASTVAATHAFSATSVAASSLAAASLTAIAGPTASTACAEPRRRMLGWLRQHAGLLCGLLRRLRRLLPIELCGIAGRVRRGHRRLRWQPLLRRVGRAAAARAAAATTSAAAREPVAQPIATAIAGATTNAAAAAAVAPTTSAATIAAAAPAVASTTSAIASAASSTTHQVAISTPAVSSGDAAGAANVRLSRGHTALRHPQLYLPTALPRVQCHRRRPFNPHPQLDRFAEYAMGHRRGAGKHAHRLCCHLQSRRRGHLQSVALAIRGVARIRRRRFQHGPHVRRPAADGARVGRPRSIHGLVRRAQ